MLLKENTGLIVIDIQGKLARLVHNSDSVIANCVKLVQGVQVLDLPIILLEQNPEKLGSTVDELRSQLASTLPITKFTFDACEEPAFLQSIESAGVDTWLVCGIEAHICVYQTARGLVERGYRVELLTDCVSSRDPLNIQLAINRLADVGVQITGLEMCFYELVKDCKASQFKQILSLVR